MAKRSTSKTSSAAAGESAPKLDLPAAAPAARERVPGPSAAAAPAAPGRPYTVLARRYRSRSFDELIGQEPIARTLQNAIRTGRTAHAYLFCGTRGVGKTSMARIVAAALNVTPELSEAEAIRAAIMRGDDLDVIEIDGASNRGIEQARDLIAGAGLSPARCPYKVYIIDEVHALTKDAFNALLKTMEEPPAHVKFILCTTEPAKVPATIQSRCQRFDFRPLTSPQIARQLRLILQAEGIEADDAVIAHLARLGDGSMRDALSILDRLLSAGEPRLTETLLEQMLGLPDESLIVALVDAIIAADAAASLRAAEALIAHGITVEQTLELLTVHLRALMITAACGDEAGAVLDLSSEAMETARRQAAHFDAPGLVHLIALCEAVARNARGSSCARALLDAAVVRMALSAHLADIAPLLRGETPDGRAAATLTEPKKKDPLTPPPRLIGSSSPEAGESASAGGGIVREVKPAVGAAAEGEDLWRAVRAAVAGDAMSHALIEGLTPASLEGRLLRLRVRDEASGRARFLAQQGEQVAAIIERATARRLRVEIEAGPGGDAPRGAAPIPPDAVDAARRLPLVQRAMELFDAAIAAVDPVEPRPRGG